MLRVSGGPLWNDKLRTIDRMQAAEQSGSGDLFFFPRPVSGAQDSDSFFQELASGSSPKGDTFCTDH